MNGWTFKMAWRDSRSHRKRLLLFVTSIVLGIAAIVSVGSFGVNLDHAINQQAKTLMGADLRFSTLRPYPEEVEALIDSMGGEQAREFLFSSMAYFPKSGGSRLVQVRAMQGNFPFYGEIGTIPDEASKRYQESRRALVDETLLLQYQVQVGDSVKIGRATFAIAGKIIKLPDNSAIASTINPRIYIPARYLAEMQLLQRGSLVRHRVYFKLADAFNIEAFVTRQKPFLNRHRIDVDTVEDRKRQIGRVMENLYRFLSLVGFVALVLGSIGVASAVHVYIRQKVVDISILRCMGAEAKQTFSIYLLQVMLIALTGALAGAAAGVSIQMLLPQILKDFIPVDIEPFIVWREVFYGIGVGFALSMLFAMLPLVSIRKISPLLALRTAFESHTTKDKLRWLIVFLMMSFVTGYAILQSTNWIFGLSFSMAVVVAFLVLGAAARLITYLSRRFFPKSWSYVWRQGLSNLHRPNNQTLILMISIGLGTFLITTLYLSQETLLSKVSYDAGGERPNLILYDIQPDQKESISQLIQTQNLKIIQEAPMVTMRLKTLRGELVEDILSDTTRDISQGLLRWEFRTTYRDTLFDSEEIVAGQWIGRFDSPETGVIPISFDDGSAARLGLGLGDTLVWDVQGVPLTTRIASLRKVDWQRVQANFMVVFPEGALEYAPQIFIFSTNTPAADVSAALQNKVLRAFPNVSIIDIGLVLRTVDTLLKNISFAIRFMAFFSIFTGLLVLSAAVSMSRFQRIHENVLLRTLGASRKQVTTIMLVEYLFLGSFAALTGLILSYASAWALAFFVFEAIFLPTIIPFIVVIASVAGLTVLIGMFNSRGILDRPPLEILRAET